MSGALVVQGVQFGIPSGEKDFGPYNIPMSSVDESLSIVAQAGDNIVGVPAGSNGCVIVPPAGGTETLLLKILANDAGVPLSGTQPTVWSWPAAAGPSTFIINSSIALSNTEPIEVVFF